MRVKDEGWSQRGGGDIMEDMGFDFKKRMHAVGSEVASQVVWQLQPTIRAPLVARLTTMHGKWFLTTRARFASVLAHQAQPNMLSYRGGCGNMPPNGVAKGVLARPYRGVQRAHSMN